MSIPYVLPQGLQNAPLGIAWNQIPDLSSSPQQRFAEQLNISWRATHMVDAYCNMVLRATLDTEEQLGPDYWLSNAGNSSNSPARLHAVRWPIIQVIGGQFSDANAFPPSWQALDATKFLLDYSVSGVSSTAGTQLAGPAGAGPAAILVAPGVVSFAGGRRGTRLNVSYINGWPHCGITATANAGTNTLTVDDVTGWAGAFGFIYDDDLTEQINVTSVVANNPTVLSLGGGSLTISVPTGPGTVTLASNLLYTHNRMVANQPTVMSCLPESVLWATMLMAASIVFTRGATATAIQQMPGSSVNTGQASSMALTKQAQEILQPYKRVL